MTPRQQAIHNGEKTYYTGTPCPFGHDAPRYLASRGCVTCRKLREVTPQHRIARKERDNIPSVRARNQTTARMSRYGLTSTAFDELLVRQNGRCAICADPISVSVGTLRGNLNVDHCHTTGKVRGLLCWSCNVAVGQLKDDAARADRTAAYIRAGCQ